MEGLMGKRKRTSLDLSEQLDRQVKSAARQSGQTKAGFIRTCILGALGYKWIDHGPTLNVGGKLK